MKTNATDPIHPSVNETNSYECNRTGKMITDFVGENGLTKREYFAAMALQGLISHHGFYSDVSKDAVLLSDGLIKALNEGKSDEQTP